MLKNIAQWSSLNQDRIKTIFSLFIFMAVVAGLAFYNLQQKATAQDKVEQQAELFAIEGMRDCHASGAHSRNFCVNESVTAAQNLRGKTFAVEVGKRLAKMQ